MFELSLLLLSSDLTLLLFVFFFQVVVGRVKEAAAALQELKATRVHVENEEGHPCDICFSGRTESVCQAREDLSQQVKIHLLWQSET